MKRVVVVNEAAYGYTRVSSEQQKKEGVSLEAQQFRIREYCERHQLPEPTFFSDPAHSGKIPMGNRKDGGQLVAALRPGDHVVITTIDRGFRNLFDFLYWFEEWLKRGVHLHVINFGGNSIDPRTAMGKLLYRMLACVAELERETMCERMVEYHAKRRRDNRLFNKNTVIPGFKIVTPQGGGPGYQLEHSPEQRELMGRMLAWQEAGKSIDWIRQHLAFTLKQSTAVFSATGREWDRNFIDKILKTEVQLRQAEATGDYSGVSLGYNGNFITNEMIKG